MNDRISHKVVPIEQEVKALQKLEEAVWSAERQLPTNNSSSDQQRKAISALAKEVSHLNNDILAPDSYLIELTKRLEFADLNGKTPDHKKHFPTVQFHDGRLEMLAIPLLWDLSNMSVYSNLEEQKTHKLSDKEEQDRAARNRFGLSENRKEVPSALVDQFVTSAKAFEEAGHQFYLLLTHADAKVKRPEIEAELKKINDSIYLQNGDERGAWIIKRLSQSIGLLSYEPEDLSVVPSYRYFFTNCLALDNPNSSKPYLVLRSDLNQQQWVNSVVNGIELTRGSSENQK